MQDLRVALIQADLAWENIPANLIKLEGMMDNAGNNPELIVLPEMFSTGFTMQSARFSETMEGSTLQWLKKQAKCRNAVITGSLIIEEGGRYFNRLVWVQPDGGTSFYNKRHLFRMGEEHLHYDRGGERFYAELNSWNFSANICYDLRFPVWNRQPAEGIKSDCMIYVANWPERRIQHWEKLIQARAIENQCYVLGVNRVGTDGNGIYHNGNSIVSDPQGNIVVKAVDEEKVITLSLNYSEINNYRKVFPVLEDMDGYTLEEGA